MGSLDLVRVLLYCLSVPAAKQGRGAVLLSVAALLLLLQLVDLALVAGFAYALVKTGHGVANWIVLALWLLLTVPLNAMMATSLFNQRGHFVERAEETKKKPRSHPKQKRRKKEEEEEEDVDEQGRKERRKP